MQQGVGGDVPEGTRSHKINVRYLPEVYFVDIYILIFLYGT